MKWTNQQVEKVRNLSIADAIGEKLGRRIKIPCPMPDHNDKTPSFLVDEDNGYHCFGCGAHGKGFIDFVTDILVKSGEAKDDKEAFANIMEEYAD